MYRRLSIVLLVILLVGCVSSGTTETMEVGGPPSTAAETETPTLTLTPTISLTPPDPTRRPTLVYPTRNAPFVETDFRYQEGVPPLTALRRLGMGFVRDLQVSPDRQSFAVGTTTGVYVFDSHTYDLLWSAATRAPVGEIKWSPSGDKLAEVPMDTSELLIWDAAGQFIKKFEKIGSFDWSPDGKQIVDVAVWFDASNQRHSGVVVWNVDTSEKTGIYEMDTSQDSSWYYWGLRWSPDGRYIAVGMEGPPPESPQLIAVLDLVTGDFLELVAPQEIRHRDIKHLEFSPDGSKLL